jgi:hypothetical protein
MFIGIVVIIITILFIIVALWYHHYVLMYYQCVTDADIWCYNDWSCEADPTRIGGLRCDGEDCKQAINDFYQGVNHCNDSCDSSGGCSCSWPEQFNQPVEDNGATCSIAKFANMRVGPGTYVCGGSTERCPSDGGSGCNPYCENPNEPGCCNAVSV